MSKWLKELSATGLQGQSFHHVLGTVTAFCGDYDTHKSARLAAGRFLFLNHDPMLGKREGDTWKRATGDLMRISGTFSDGEKIVKEWVSKNGTVSQTKGSDDPIVPVTILDPAKWFTTGTGASRLNYIFSLVDLDALGYTSASIMDAMSAAEFSDEVREETVASWVKSFKELATLYRKQIDKEKGTIQQWVEQILNNLTQQLKDSRAIVKRMTEAARAAVQLDTNSGPLPRDVKDLIKSAEAKIEGLKLKRTQRNADIKDCDANEEKIAQLERHLAQFDERVKRKDDLLAQTSSMTTALQTDWSFAEEPAKEWEEAKKTSDELKKKLDEQEEAISEEQEAFELNYAAKCCPTCDTKGTTWKKTLKKKHEAESGQLQSERLKMRKRYLLSTDVVAAKQTAKDSYDKLTAEHRSFVAQLPSLNHELRQLEESLCAHTAAENELKVRKGNRTLLASKATDAKANLLVLDESILKEANALAELRAEHDRWTAQQTMEAHHAQTRKELRDAKDKAACVNAVVDALTAKQVEMIDDAMKSILIPVNKFTRGFMESEFVYHNGDFGYWHVEGGHRTWVYHTVFSNTVKNLAYAGFAVALCQSSPIKIVFMDGLDVDYEHKVLLFQRLVEMVSEGVIDQVLATDISDACKKVPGVTVIEMEAA